MGEFKLIRPIDDLQSLRFLSEIRTEKEYMEKSDGPYLVGHIVDKESFTCKSPQRRSPIIREIDELDITLGFLGDRTSGYEFDDGPARKGCSQRATSWWHQDNGGYRPIKNGFIDHLYLASSNGGTLFLRETIARQCPIPINDARAKAEIYRWAEENGALIKGADYGIYLMPIRTWHCSPIQDNDRPRTFMRM